MRAKLLQLFPTLCTLWTPACQTPLSMGFSRQEYCTGLPCPPPYALTILSFPDITIQWNRRTAVIPFHRWLSKSLRVKEFSKITHTVSEGTRDRSMLVYSQFLAPITSPQEGPAITHSHHGGSHSCVWSTVIAPAIYLLLLHAP